MKYQRFVAYVYEYRKGKKENNCGFLRAEMRDEKITIEIHIKCPGLPSDEKCSIYGFIRKDRQMEGILLGAMRSEEEKLDCIIESDKTDDMRWKEKFPEFGGMIIRTENGAFFGTEWDDIPIVPGDFEINNRSEKTECNSEQEVSIELEQEVNREENVEINKEDHAEVLKEVKAEANKDKKAEATVTAMDIKTAAFCPFHDDEITECRKIHPNEFFKTCPKACALRNNRFLEHGYYNFGHLLVGKRANGQNILGIPGGYDQQERFMANMFGFPYFKESPEIQLPGGRGGYWYRLLNPANFH